MVQSRLDITRRAKRKARQALRRRKSLSDSEKFGLSASEAREKGVNSGVARARQIIRSDSISFEDAKRVCAFRRFSKQDDISKKERGAINLWGGSKFIEKACSHVKKIKKGRRRGNSA